MKGVLFAKWFPPTDHAQLSAHKKTGLHFWSPVGVDHYRGCLALDLEKLQGFAFPLEAVSGRRVECVFHHFDTIVVFDLVPLRRNTFHYFHIIRLHHLVVQSIQTEEDFGFGVVH